MIIKYSIYHIDFVYYFITLKEVKYISKMLHILLLKVIQI